MTPLSVSYFVECYSIVSLNVSRTSSWSFRRLYTLRTLWMLQLTV